jgi:hypothetical protein
MTQANPTQRFDYRFSNARLLAMSVLLIILPLIFVDFARTNRRGLRISGLVLSPDQAVTFFWIAAALLLVAAAIGFIFIIRSLRSAGFVQLGADEVLLPRASLRGELMQVPYVAIQSVQVVMVANRQLVNIVTLEGDARLSAAAFKGERDFTRFVRILKERVAATGNI